MHRHGGSATHDGGHTCLFSIQLGSRVVVERLVIVDEVETEPVDAVCGVNGGLDLGPGTVVGIEKGERKGRIVQCGAIAHLIEGVASGRVAALGDVTDTVGIVAGAIGDGVKADERPDLSSAMEASGGTNEGQVASGVVGAQTWDVGDVAGRGKREQRFDTTVGILDQGFCVSVLGKETLNLCGQRGIPVSQLDHGIEAYEGRIVKIEFIKVFKIPHIELRSLLLHFGNDFLEAISGVYGLSYLEQRERLNTRL